MNGGDQMDNSSRYLNRIQYKIRNEYLESLAKSVTLGFFEI